VDAERASPLQAEISVELREAEISAELRPHKRRARGLGFGRVQRRFRRFNVARLQVVRAAAAPAPGRGDGRWVGRRASAAPVSSCPLLQGVELL